jgi:predicted secreted Zn-dependent protease
MALGWTTGCTPTFPVVAGAASGSNGGAWFGGMPRAAADRTDGRSKTGVVAVTRREERYALVGSNRAELAADLRDRLPGEEGFTGWTRWRLTWSMEPIREVKGCKPGKVDVRLNVTRVLPEWKAPRQASKQLKTSWQRYIRALEDHEEEHALLAEEAAEDLHKALRALPPQAECADLTRQAEKVADRAISTLRKANAELDDRTDHGARDGAIFPGPR